MDISQFKVSFASSSTGLRLLLYCLLDTPPHRALCRFAILAKLHDENRYEAENKLRVTGDVIGDFATLFIFTHLHWILYLPIQER